MTGRTFQRKPLQDWAAAASDRPPPAAENRKGELKEPAFALLGLWSGALLTAVALAQEGRQLGILGINVVVGPRVFLWWRRRRETVALEGR